ncbi:hypothetical protein ACFQ3N_01395 [Virgibacillus byunsanensis]|uniref:Uncharacterized protein n=1 Tax=Virgibacillus byunsanensis TaxID=570945 RepID=A0ABW3LFE4_9BACI
MSKLKGFNFESTAKGIRATREGVKTMKRFNNSIDDMDQAFPSGIFTAPDEKVPNLRFRNMYNWCQENGRNPETLTKEEIDQFKLN